ncbi:hypothetical protein GGR56DRAFT_671664 [Xylariaceae sp. FL0804]|nr:hypothetical protein GGR56DRAFT_671664 [Xylariaceae sp. FL0804]
MRYDGYDPLSTTSLERPRTNCGFRQPQPFFVPLPAPAAAEMRHEHDAMRDDAEPYAHAISTPDDAAWPLSTAGGYFLPDVPEEESNPSPPLRSSFSVPLLRHKSLTEAQCPFSNGSETLGGDDLNAAQCGIEQDEVDICAAESWEDSIDYCYDHAAEADCNYAWERPSIDLTREDYSNEDGKSSSNYHYHVPSKGRLATLALETSEVPALSPASLTSSAATSHEAVTPTMMAAAAPAALSNFSLPRRDSSAANLLYTGGGRQLQKPQSRVASFQESQGFKLSPSLLIPNDFHQQMLLYERERERGEQHLVDEQLEQQQHQYLPSAFVDEYLDEEYRDKTTAMTTAQQARSSASTDSSVMTSSSSAHKSTTSMATAYTRWTGSSTSSAAGWQAHLDDLQQCTAAAKPLEFEPTPDSSSFPLMTTGHARAQSDAKLMLGMRGSNNSSSNSFSNGDDGDKDEVAPLGATTLAKEQPVRVRQRARTTSRSGHGPPQFALYPQLGPRF